MSSFIYWHSIAKSSQVSVSWASERASISLDVKYFGYLLLPNASAMFAHTDLDERRT